MKALVQPDHFETNKTKLSTSSIVGHTTATSTRLWVRVYREGIWHLVVSTERLVGSAYDLDGLSLGDFLAGQAHKTIDPLQHEITLSTGLTHTYDIEGLEANQRYYYYLIADETIEGVCRRIELGSLHQYSFRTIDEKAQSFCFGFYSCHDPFSVHPHSEGAWGRFEKILIERNAQLVIGGGDQVYCDTNKKKDMQDIWIWLKHNKKALIKKYTLPDHSLDKTAITRYFTQLYRMYYRIYWNFESLKSVYKRFPQYMIWDDHEIMDGWGSLTQAERLKKISFLIQTGDDSDFNDLIMLMFNAASQVYYEYQHSHNPKTGIESSSDFSQGAALQWDYGFTQGDYAFYMLDVRGHHDVTRTTDTRLLGAAQMQRFKSWLSSAVIASKKAVFVCSPVPIVHWNEKFVNTADFGGQKDDFMDEWGHETNQKERNVLLAALFEASQNNQQIITVLSGDVHCASAFKISDPKHFPDAQVFNVTSSAISRSPAPKLAVAAIQKTAAIDGYAGGYFEQLYRFSGENNFLLVNANNIDEALSVSVNLYWSNQGTDDVSQKILSLV